MGLSTFLSNAQTNKRKCDVSSEMLLPLQNDTLWSPSYVPVKLAITNHGPDSIFIGDRFQINFKIGNYYPATKFRSAKHNLGIGDTLHLNAVVYVRGNVTNRSFICATPYLAIPIKDSLILESKEEREKNKSCKDIQHQVTNPPPKTLRYIKLGCEIISPKDGTYVHDGANLPIQMLLSNIGPDTLWKGEEISWTFRTAVNQNLSLSTHVLEKDMAAGDTILVMDTLYVYNSPVFKNNRFYLTNGYPPFPVRKKGLQIAFASDLSTERDSVLLHFIGLNTDHKQSVSTKEILVYPNPVKSNRVQLVLPNKPLPNETYIFSLTTLSGQILWSNQVRPLQSPTQVHIPKIPNGMYVLKIKSASLHAFKKLVIDRVP